MTVEKRALNLRELVELEGWRYEETAEPSQHPGALGTPQTDPLCYAQACEGQVLAVKPGNNGFAFYAAAHEIAEARLDFEGHSQHVWREQCNILSRWCRRLWKALEPTVEDADARAAQEADNDRQERKWRDRLQMAERQGRAPLDTDEKYPVVTFGSEGFR